MNIEETLLMYSPDWKHANEIQPCDIISFWGNWVSVIRTESRDGEHDLAIVFHPAKGGPEKSFTCRSSDLVATKRPT